MLSEVLFFPKFTFFFNTFPVSFLDSSSGQHCEDWRRECPLLLAEGSPRDLNQIPVFVVFSLSLFLISVTYKRPVREFNFEETWWYSLFRFFSNLTRRGTITSLLLLPRAPSTALPIVAAKQRSSPCLPPLKAMRIPRAAGDRRPLLFSSLGLFPPSGAIFFVPSDC